MVALLCLFRNLTPRRLSVLIVDDFRKGHLVLARAYTAFPVVPSLARDTERLILESLASSSLYHFRDVALSDFALETTSFHNCLVFQLRHSSNLVVRISRLDGSRPFSMLIFQCVFEGSASKIQAVHMERGMNAISCARED